MFLDEDPGFGDKWVKVDRTEVQGLSLRASERTEVRIITSENNLENDELRS